MGDDDRRAVGKLGNDAHVAAHGFDGFSQRRKQQVAAFFKAGDAVLGDSEGLGTRAWVSLRAFRMSRKLISSAMISTARSSTFFRSAGLSFRIILFTFTGMITSPTTHFTAVVWHAIHMVSVPCLLAGCPYAGFACGVLDSYCIFALQSHVAHPPSV